MGVRRVTLNPQRLDEKFNTLVEDNPLSALSGVTGQLAHEGGDKSYKNDYTFASKRKSTGQINQNQLA